MKKLWVWLLFLVGVNVVWLLIDKTPPAWDQAAHIRSVVLASNYFSGSFWGSFVDLIRSFGGYPPLIYLIGGLWASIFGVGVAEISFLNIIFLMLAIIGVYRLAKENELAVLVFSLMPVIYDISRNFLLDLPLTVFVVWGLYFWIKSEDLKKDKYSFSLLVMLILASLTKLNGFIYFAPIGLWILFNNLKRVEVWMKLVIGGAIYLLAVGWWWGINFSNIYQYLTGLAGQGEKLTDPMNLLDWVTWIHYFRLFFLHQVGPVLAIVAVISWIKIPKTGENKKMIFWVIAVYVIFTIIRNKDFRFTMPILPVVALWLGDWLSKIKYKWMTYIFIVYLFFNFVENSFGWPLKKPVQMITPTFLMGDVDWLNFTDYPVRSTNRVVWPTEKIAEKMVELEIGKLLVLVNTAEINDNNIKMYRDMLTDEGDKVLEMHSAYVSNFNDWQNFEAVLVGGKDFEPAPFYAVNLEYLKQSRDFIWQNPERFELVGEYYLPSGESVYLMRVR